MRDDYDPAALLVTARMQLVELLTRVGSPSPRGQRTLACLEALDRALESLGVTVRPRVHD